MYQIGGSPIIRTVVFGGRYGRLGAGVFRVLGTKHRKPARLGFREQSRWSPKSSSKSTAKESCRVLSGLRV